MDYTYFALQYFKKALQALGKGSAQDNINLGTFQKHYFPFPNLNKQREIVDILNVAQSKYNKVILKYQDKLSCIDELKKSILQKAFNGELTEEDIKI